MSKPHEAEFFLYFPHEAEARQAGERISAMGFQTTVDRAADDSAWLCLAERTMVPTLEALVDVRLKFTALAEELGGDYEGWETAVVK